MYILTLSNDTYISTMGAMTTFVINSDHGGKVQGDIMLLVMYRAWLGLKALAWTWLGWAWALEILSQA